MGIDGDYTHRTIPKVAVQLKPVSRGMAMINFACPQCHQGFKVEDKAAGKKTKCPKCGAVLVPINGQITLAQKQILRHRMFRWLRDRWLAQHPVNWKEFFIANAADFGNKFPGRHLAPRGILASNLAYFLRQLDAFGPCIQDVLLYFRLARAPWPNGVLVPDGMPNFKVVPFVYNPLNDGGIVDMEA